MSNDNTGKFHKGAVDRRDVRPMQSWRAKIFAIGAAVGSLLFVRDMWIAPNPVARVWDLKFLACVALLALIIWLARRSPYAKAAVFLAGSVASVLVGVHEWASGKQFELFLCALVFLSLIGSTVFGIKQIAEHSAGRRTGCILDKDEDTLKHDF
jgi:hypothetical protein